MGKAENLFARFDKLHTSQEAYSLSRLATGYAHWGMIHAVVLSQLDPKNPAKLIDEWEMKFRGPDGIAINTGKLINKSIYMPSEVGPQSGIFNSDYLNLFYLYRANSKFFPGVELSEDELEDAFIFDPRQLEGDRRQYSPREKKGFIELCREPRVKERAIRYGRNIRLLAVAEIDWTIGQDKMLEKWQDVARQLVDYQEAVLSRL